MSKRPLKRTRLGSKVFIPGFDKPMAPLNKRQKKTVKRLVAFRREAKYDDHVTLGSNMTTTPTVVDLFTPAQGDTDITRDGDMVSLKSFKINMSLIGCDGSAVGPDPYNICRIIIFQWIPDSALQVPNAGNILIVTSDPLSQLNHDQRTNYKILFDRIVDLHQFDSAEQDGKSTRIIRFTARKLRKNVLFDSGTTAGTNKIYILFMSDSTLTDDPTIAYRSRAEFYDS